MSELEEHFATLREVEAREGRSRLHDYHACLTIQAHLKQLEWAVAWWRAAGSPEAPPPEDTSLSGRAQPPSPTPTAEEVARVVTDAINRVIRGRLPIVCAGDDAPFAAMKQLFSLFQPEGRERS